MPSTKRRAYRKLRVENVDSLVVPAEPQLFRRQDHPLALDAAHGPAAQNRPLPGVSVDDRRALVRVRNDRTLAQIRRARDHGLRSARPVVDRGELQLVGVRMLREL
ncbi:MAG: hypothetical protein AUH39_03270 [Chloroflexi bacterium 13_1_40CM_67_9]|nr:MAG: hypothetical protein AUH39_03270 [Chloroflexi bacterium 13_1_40CM_67_9]